MASSGMRHKVQLCNPPCAVPKYGCTSGHPVPVPAHAPSSLHSQELPLPARSLRRPQARTSFKRILAAASDPSDALHLDLELDEEQLAAMEAAVRPPPRRGLSRGASRGRNSGPGGVGHSGGEEQQGAGAGGQLGVVQEGAGEEGGGVRVGAGREGGRGAGGRYTPSEGGGSDKVAPSVGEWGAGSGTVVGLDLPELRCCGEVMIGVHDSEESCCLAAVTLVQCRPPATHSNGGPRLPNTACGQEPLMNLQTLIAACKEYLRPHTLCACLVSLAMAHLRPTCSSTTPPVSPVPCLHTPTPGWSEASSAVSLGFDTLPPPEAPALPPPRRSATGTPLAHPRAPAAGAAPYVPAGTQAHTAPSHGGAAPGRALQRSASSRQGPRVVPQVVVTDDGRIAGDVDDLDLLDLDSGDDDEDAGQGLGEDGSVPSGVGLVGDQGGGSFRVVQHGDDDGDGDSVF